MKRGDIPYVFTAAGRNVLFSDGEKLQDDVFALTAKEHALDNLFAMDNIFFLIYKHSPKFFRSFLQENSTFWPKQRDNHSVG